MNYYNEFDPKAAAWLRELIADGLIPDGHVDERSIIEVKPDDLRGYTQCHFFAGVGGWSRALRLAEWPDDQPVWTGSAPCQPFSCAGKGLGEADERHLWPAFFWLIDAIRPPIVFSEQVASKAALSWIDGVFANLEGAGYACTANDLCAASVGAPHIRQRLFWVAISASVGCGSLGTEPAGLVGSAKPDDGRAHGGLAHSERDAWRADESRREPQGRAADGRCCEAVRLADAELRRPEQRDAGQRSVQQPHAHGTDGRLGDMQQPRLEGHAGNGDDGHQPGRDGTNAPGPVATAGGVGWLEHAEIDGHEGRSLRTHREPQVGIEKAGFWHDAIWHECRDGKARRIPRPEPGVLGVVDGLPEGLDTSWLESSFPLCEKIKGRTQLLKGYGNAIVPQVGAAFVRAVRDAIGEL